MKRWEIEALQDLDNPDDYHVPIRTLLAFAALAVLVVGFIVWATIAIPPLGVALAGLVLGWYARGAHDRHKPEPTSGGYEDIGRDLEEMIYHVAPDRTPYYANREWKTDQVSDDSADSNP